MSNDSNASNQGQTGIVLCGVCKNVISTLPVIRAAFEELAAKAGVPCWAVFYENNSDDGTDAELLKWAAEAPGQVKVQCDKFGKEEELSRGAARTFDNQPCRMERIAYARNKLLEMLVGEYSSPNPSSGDVHVPTVPVGGAGGFAPRYVVMIDMDNPVPFPVNNVLRCIARDPDGFDALVCNGLNSMGQMYDTYAYRDAQFPFGPEVMREAFWSGHYQYYVQTAVHNKTMFHKHQMKQNQALLPYIPIASGFNGMCIFRWEALKGMLYSAIPTAEMNAEYEAMNYIPRLSNTHLNGASVGMYLFPKYKEADNKGIFYFHNSGYNFPVVCEHVPFFAGMRARNYRRIYLCTDLVWNWL